MSQLEVALLYMKTHVDTGRICRYFTQRVVTTIRSPSDNAARPPRFYQQAVFANGSQRPTTINHKIPLSGIYRSSPATIPRSVVTLPATRQQQAITRRGP